MSLFKIEKNKVQKIKSVEAKKEKDIQKIFEENLETILNVYFLATEYTTSFGGRIDTLGVDKDKSPVIIEYKKTQNESIINQGLSYLKWLLDHKDTFEKLVAERLSELPDFPLFSYNGTEIERSVNWESPRVICIAESYNKFDLDTVDMLPIKIELYTYTIYENDVLQIESPNYQKIKIQLSDIVKNNGKQEEKKLQKEYSVDYHLNKTNQKVKSLFYKLREKIISIDEEIAEDSKKTYIAYKIDGTNFTDILFYKDELRLALNVKSGKINDPHNLTLDFTKPKKGHLGNGDYEAKISKEEDLEKVFDLIKQSYNYNK